MSAPIFYIPGKLTYRQFVKAQYDGDFDGCRSEGEDFNESARPSPDECKRIDNEARGLESGPEGFTDGPLKMVCVNPAPTPSAVSAEAREAGDAIYTSCIHDKECSPEWVKRRVQRAIDRARANETIAQVRADRAEIERLTKERKSALDEGNRAWGINTSQCVVIAMMEGNQKEAQRELAENRETIARLESELTLHHHRCEAARNAGQRGLPKGDCECSVCRPFYQKLARLESEVAKTRAEYETLCDNLRATIGKQQEAMHEAVAITKAECAEKLAAVTKERSDLVEMIQTAEREGCIDVSDDDCELWRMVESFFSRARALWEEKLVAQTTRAERLAGGVEVIANERDTQKAKGWDSAHDNTHTRFELIENALVCLQAYRNGCFHAPPGSDPWGLGKKHHIRGGHNPRLLAIAGALIVAEIERVARKALAEEKA